MAKQNGDNDRYRLTAEEELELFRRFKDEGDMEARDKLVEYSQGFVSYIANGYRSSGMEMDDLISEGNIGLLKAIEKFDYKKGYRLNTYAGLWIRSAIYEFIRKNKHTIRLPEHVQDKLIKIHKFSIEYMDDNGKEPSVEEIADAVGLKPEEVNLYFDANQKMSSLDYQIDDDSSLSDLIPDDSSSLEEMLENRDKYERIIKAINRCLNDKERIFMIKFYDLDNSGGLNKKEISKILGVSEQRVGQIEKDAMHKLHIYFILQDRSFDQ